MQTFRQILIVRSFESNADLLQWISNASGTRVEVDDIDGEIDSIQSFQFMLDGSVAFLLNISGVDREAHVKKAEELLEP